MRPSSPSTAGVVVVFLTLSILLRNLLYIISSNLEFFSVYQTGEPYSKIGDTNESKSWHANIGGICPMGLQYL
jgi:hypothetical protein